MVLVMTYVMEMRLCLVTLTIRINWCRKYWQNATSNYIHNLDPNNSLTSNDLWRIRSEVFVSVMNFVSTPLPVLTTPYWYVLSPLTLTDLSPIADSLGLSTAPVSLSVLLSMHALVACSAILPRQPPTSNEK